ncbi:MAG: TIGR03663 family protein, partial [Chloroflexi bacterium]|nr:TIGR03663 family protein [Chloroflexota bacterium]
RRPDAIVLVVLAIAAVALALRLYELGVRALHHDESLHATYSWYFQHARPLYRHDPLMHGPFQFHAMAGFFKLFGDGDAMARMPAALAGTALVLTPLLLRRWLGAAGTIAAALFLALSPSLLYYSRFAREDIYSALWTALLMIAGWRYQQDGRDRWLAVVAGALALGFATKESVYLVAAVLLVYLDVMLTLALLDQRGSRGEQRLWEGVLLAPVAWLLAALALPLAPLWRRLGFVGLPRAGALLIVVGVLTLPQLAAAAQLPAEALDVVVAGETERRLGVITVCVLLGLATIAGLLWDWRRWLLVAAVFYGITIPLFTTGFTNVRGGVMSDLWDALDYWLAQQDVRRGEQPWFYYVFMLPLYEVLVLVPALAAAVWLAMRRHDALAGLLAWWFAGSFIALSYAGEKMPWLLVHLALPLALLAALGIGRAWAALTAPAAVPRRRAAAWVGPLLLAVLLLPLAAYSLRTARDVVYVHPDTPIEPLIYTQTSPDVPALSREIHELSRSRPGGLQVFVDESEALPWPWAWYLRDVSFVGYLPASDFATVGAQALVITARSTTQAHPELRELRPDQRAYRHRWWFPEEGYKAYDSRSKLATLRKLWTDVWSGKLPAGWAEFARERVDASMLGSLDGDVLFPAPPGTAGP